MYLRESKQRRADGSTVAYLQLAENVWNPEKRRSETRILCNCGRADDAAVTERLRRLAHSILRRCSAEDIVGAADGDWRLVCAWPYGDVYALEALWQRLGIGQIIGAQAGARRMGFDVERALFAMVRYLPEEGHTQRVCALRASGRYGRYLRDTDAGLLLDREKVQAAERFDGKFVVHGNDDTLSAEDMALGYKQLMRVEQAWRDMKSGLQLRPVFHWTPHRIHAHVAITVLALLLERTAEHACGDTWRNIQDRLRRIQLAQLLSPNGTVWQVTEPTADAAKCLQTLKIKPPAPILGLA